MNDTGMNVPQRHYIARCVNSVRDQLADADQHIIYDDGSTERSGPDEGFFPVSPQIHPGMLMMWMKDRKGVSYARNRCIERATGEWIKFLDADDLLAPYALNALRALEKGGELSSKIKVVIGTQMQVVDGLFRGIVHPAPQVIENYNPFVPSMAFVRRETLLEVGMFDERIEFEEDWDLWLRIYRKYGGSAFAKIDYPVCYYWIDQEERKTKFNPSHEVEGMDVRAYFRKQYGIDPK